MSPFRFHEANQDSPVPVGANDHSPASIESRLAKSHPWYIHHAPPSTKIPVNRHIVAYFLNPYAPSTYGGPASGGRDSHHEEREGQEGRTDDLWARSLLSVVSVSSVVQNLFSYLPRRSPRPRRMQKLFLPSFLRALRVLRGARSELPAASRRKRFTRPASRSFPLPAPPVPAIISPEIYPC